MKEPKENFINGMFLTPSYGWEVDGELVKPSFLDLVKGWCKRMNIVGSKTNWYTFLCTTALFFSGIVFFVFITFFFDWLSLVVALVFAFIIMGTQQTIWHHRYATHPAYKIKYNWVKIFIRNMVPRFLLEGVYVVSHYVHHALSDEPGDPYNAKGGFWYCMLSDENHQCIARNLSENDYKRARNLLVHSGIYTNSYEEY